MFFVGESAYSVRGDEIKLSESTYPAFYLRLWSVASARLWRPLCAAKSVRMQARVAESSRPKWQVIDQ